MPFPLSEWWFWIFVAIPLAGISVGLVAVIGDVLIKLRKARFGGVDDTALSELRDQLHALQAELGEQRKVHRVLELQKQLSSSDLQTIEAQTLPEGIAVFMFSDIEGFTTLIDRLGDEAAFELLQRHNRLLRALARRHDGIEIKQLGDGFMFCFASARKALHCAAEIQAQLAGLGEEAGAPVRVRLGLHAGEPIQDERDFIGQTVNLTERIMDQAAGGQTFTSELVRDLAGTLKGYQFVAQGVRRLEGIQKPQTLYQFQPIEALASPLDSEVNRRLSQLEADVAPRAGEGA